MFKQKKDLFSHRTSPRNKRGHGPEKIKTWGLTGFVAGTLALIFAPSIWQPELDDKTLCEKGKAQPVQETIVVDLTSKWDSPEELRKVKAYIQEQAHSIPFNSRFSLFVIAADEENQATMRLLFSKCRPSDGSRESRIDRDPDQIKRRYQKEYQGALEEVVSGLEKMKASSTSPLLELFSRTKTFPGVTGSTTEERRLKIITDLIQHSSELSQYAQKYSFPADDKLFMRQAKGSMAGVKVEVLLRNHKESRPFQTEEHRRFWRRFFEEVCGASFDRIRL